MATTVTRLKSIGRAPDRLREELRVLGFDRVASDTGYALYALAQGRSVRAIGVFSIVNEEVLATRSIVCLPGVDSGTALKVLLEGVYRRVASRHSRLTYFAYVTNQVTVWQVGARLARGLCYPHPHRSDPPFVAMLRVSLPRRLGFRACSFGNPANAGLSKSNGTSRLTVAVLRDWWEGYAQGAALMCVGTFPQTS